MYDTRLTDIDLSLDYILEQITEYDIYRYYIGESFQIGRIMSSPLREDKNPSFGLFKSNKSGSLLFKDQATGISGNCVTFVKELFNISYRDAIIKIIGDLVKQNLKMSVKGISIKKEYKPVETVLAIRRKNFSENDDLYWGQFGLNRDILKTFNVFPIHEYWINGIVQPWAYKVDNPGYAYQIYNKFKIYKPLEQKKYKWLTNCSMLDIQGYEQLDNTGNLLIITKSLKDVMVLTKLGYNAVAPQGENHHIPSKVMLDLENRFKKIIVFYDNDEAGIIGANKISKRYNLQTIFIPDNEPKDISDYVKKYGLDKAKELIKTLLDGRASTEIQPE